MAKKVPIGIFNTARTQVRREAVQAWLDFIGVSSDFAIPDNEVISDPALLVAINGKRCYMSFEVGLNPNVTKIREDWTEYIDNILKSGHGSVVEHSVYTFAIENVSRVFTGEMNRHRAGWAISEGSMRFIRFSEDVPYWEPDSIKGPDVLDDVQSRGFFEYDYKELEQRITTPGDTFHGLDPDEKREASRIMFERHFDNQRDWYKVMEAIWAEELAPKSQFTGKKALTSMMRRGIGMGCATGGVWTGNFRALRHVIAQRTSEHAEEEILHVFSRIAKMMVEEEPTLFGDFEEINGYWKPRYVKI